MISLKLAFPGRPGVFEIYQATRHPKLRLADPSNWWGQLQLHVESQKVRRCYVCLCFLFATFYSVYYFILFVLLMLFLLYSSWFFVQTQDALTKCISCVCRTGSSEKECLTVWRVWPAFKKTIPIMCLFKPETSALTSQTSESSAGSGRASGDWCGHLNQFDSIWSVFF